MVMDRHAMSSFWSRKVCEFHAQNKANEMQFQKFIDRQTCQWPMAENRRRQYLDQTKFPRCRPSTWNDSQECSTERNLGPETSTGAWVATWDRAHCHTRRSLKRKITNTRSVSSSMVVAHRTQHTRALLCNTTIFTRFNSIGDVNEDIVTIIRRLCRRLVNYEIGEEWLATNNFTWKVNAAKESDREKER